MATLVFLLLFSGAFYYGYRSITMDERKMANTALPQFVGSVKRVIDGDTIDVSDGQRVHRVRICGIDAPESNQEGGAQATSALARVATGRMVQVIGVEIDKYNRLVAYVNLSGEDLGVAMITAGLAWADRYGKTPREFLVAEHTARAARKGIWAGPFEPVYPADFRRA